MSIRDNPPSSDQESSALGLYNTLKTNQVGRDPWIRDIAKREIAFDSDLFIKLMQFKQLSKNTTFARHIYGSSDWPVGVD